MSEYCENSEALCTEFVTYWRRGARRFVEDFLSERQLRVSADIFRELLSRESELRCDLAKANGVVVNDFSGNGGHGSEGDAASPIAGDPNDTQAFDMLLSADASCEFATSPSSSEKLDANIGRYQVREVLGQGGFGVVYRAWDPVLTREVAIKRLRSHVHRTVDFRSMLEREAQLICRLDHPHIIPVWDFDWDSEGRAYIVSKYIPARSLRRLIAEAKPSYSRAAAICAAIARALHHAHTHQIVHRDVKPENILVDVSGHVWLTDFGLGSLVNEVDQMWESCGTPAYMSPEQAAINGDYCVDHRSDIFSLGVVFYELLTGVNPFYAKSLTELDRLLRANVRPCRLVNEQIPKTFDEICLRALRRDPMERFLTARDFAESIEDVMTYRPTPINVAHIAIPPSLQGLMEELSRNNHDIWAEQRIAEGWQVGDARNDELKIHPDLVPYDELSEGEKQYDRRTVEHTIKAILAAGYTVHPPSS